MRSPVKGIGGSAKWVFIMGLVLWSGHVLTVPGQAKLALTISATCENAVLLINGRVYSGRPVTLLFSLGEGITLQAVHRQLPNCGTQQVLHYFDRWDFNGEPYSKAPQQLRLRAGQVPFTTDARVQAVYRSQPADFCDVAIDAQESLGKYLHGTFVEVRPLDILGEGGGVTPFVRSFDTLTDVLLQASSHVTVENKGYHFARWEIEGAQLLTPPSADPTLIKLRCSSSRVLAHAIYTVASRPTGCPDLTIRHLYGETSQISPYAWLLKPRAYVENIGTAPVPVPSTTSFYLNGQLIDQVTTSPLAPGAGEQASITHVITAGSYILTTVVDDKNQVTECNEDNNTKEVIVTVP